MKTAIYAEDGITQIVLTPENEFERDIVESTENKNLSTSIVTGQFYSCAGGWVRHSEYNVGQSIIIKVEMKK